MPKFKIAIHPAVKTQFGPAVDLSRELKSVVIECKLEDLRDVMQETAAGIVSPVPEKPLLYVHASPTGRSANGYIGFKQAGQNVMLIRSASAEPARSQSIDTVATI